MFGTMFSSIHYVYGSEILRDSWNLRQMDVQYTYSIWMWILPNWMKNHLFCKWQGVSWRKVSKTLRTCSVKNINFITSYPEYFAFRFFQFGCFMVPCLLLFAWAKVSFFEAPASQDWSFKNIYRTSISTLEDVGVRDSSANSQGPKYPHTPTEYNIASSETWRLSNLDDDSFWKGRLGALQRLSVHTKPIAIGKWGHYRQEKYLSWRWRPWIHQSAAR